MSISYFACARFKMAIPDGISSVGGGIIFPVGINHPTLFRRKLERKYPHLKRRLLDPQIYLATLNAATCRSSCVNLASYGWFGEGKGLQFDSGKQTLQSWKSDAVRGIHRMWRGEVPRNPRDIEAAIQTCVGTQHKLGCEGIILPSPLTYDTSSDYGVETSWLDSGLAISRKEAPDVPRLATIALSDTCLRGRDPWTNPLLTVVLDQVTSRQPEGAYVVIEQANEQGYYCGHPNTVGALLRIIDGLQAGGVKTIVVTHMGVLGLVSVCIGASIWSGGWYRGERRLKLADLEGAQGRANPTYYSHTLAGEFHLQSDLDRVVAAKMLPRVADETHASRPLLRALRNGKAVGDVPEWQYRQSNVTAAIEHFTAVAARETERVAKLSRSERMAFVRNWLMESERLASDLYQLGSFNPRTELDHQTGWNAAFEKYLKHRLVR